MTKSDQGALKRVTVGLLAGTVAVFGVALAPTAGATEDVTTERLAGATRYGTAAAVAADEVFAAPTRAIVASGENPNLADALAASTLAGANAPAPIILTQTNTYTAEAKSGLAALKGKGVSAVTIVGGTAAVSTAVEDAIKADGFTVTRVADTNRFGTAAAVAQAANTANPADPIGGKKVALIASGFSFADALAGSPAAASGGVPLLLVNADSIPTETRAALDALDINQAVILGGTVPVSEAVASELQTLTGAAPTRLAGVNRFATAAAISDYEIGTLGFAATSVIAANGLTLVDALTAGPLGGLLEAPILLTASCPAETSTFLDAHSNTVSKLYVIGGTAAVDEATANCLTDAAQAVANDPATAGDSATASLQGPELQSVRLSDFDIEDFGTLGDGLTLEFTFTFDTAVEDNVDETSFKLYDLNTNLPTVGTEADVSGGEVAVTFPAVTGAGAALAAVEAGAVQDEDGNENPPQSVSTSPLPFGATGLEIELTDEEDGVVTFTPGLTWPEQLDINVFGPFYTFNLVGEDGTVYTVDSDDDDHVETAPDDDEASADIEVTFDLLADDDDNTTPDLDDIVRGYIASNPFISPGLVLNGDLGGDVEDTPDLEGVELPTDDGDLDDDEVLFTFDEEIDTATASSFHLYFAGSGATAVAGSAVEIDGEDVIVTFTDEQVNEYVKGAWVDAGAVSSDADNDDDEGPGGVPNIADGDPLPITAPTGDVAGPQLAGVDIVRETDSFGDFEEWEVTFTFNEELVDDDDISGFSVWFDDGDEVEEVNLDDCDTDGDDAVVCTDDDEGSDIASAVVASVEAGSVLTEDQLDLGAGNVSFANPEASFEATSTG